MQAQGNTFIVTGAGNGIGRCVALELLGRGATVIGADLNEEGLRQTAQLSSEPDRFHPRRLDIGTKSEVESFAESVRTQFTGIDGLFNVAGIARPFERAVDATESTVETLLRVNFLGATWLIGALLPDLEARPRGVIMNTSSLSALVTVPGTATYGASKAALAAYSFALAHDLRGARSSVTVTTAFPGSVWTDIVRASTVELGANEKLAEWFATKPERVARRMVNATLRGRLRVIIGKDANVYSALSGVSQALAERLSFAQLYPYTYKKQQRDAGHPAR